MDISSDPVALPYGFKNNMSESLDLTVYKAEVPADTLFVKHICNTLILHPL
jgi:hypothetical protein